MTILILMKTLPESVPGKGRIPIKAFFGYRWRQANFIFLKIYNSRENVNLTSYFACLKVVLLSSTSALPLLYLNILGAMKGNYFN